MLTSFSTIKASGYFVKVPDDAKDVSMPEQDYGNVIQYLHNRRYWTETLPYGNLKLLSLTKEIGEEQAAEVVEQYENRLMWLDYNYKGDGKEYYRKPLLSLNSLLLSLGLDPSKNYAILINNEK